ncbi:RNA polymerase sigma factor [Solimonas flava]|uniref:RNA polymerase sigma factor n=1 Tax=Solimonas flava TaxID=415849 RepID=UPI0004837C38|nr:DUF6596 domain-containing protein [Solimonas flava]
MVEQVAAAAALADVVRRSRLRLLAFLAAGAQDVAGAEDALADAVRAALEAWPETGVPRQPEAWLLTAARRRLIDAARQRRVRRLAEPILGADGEAVEAAEMPDEFPDERLKLLFVCAYPALDPAVRPALMLQVVLGLDAARIAPAYLARPATVGQRLSRAKQKIRDAGIPFEIPRPAEWPARLRAVLEAVYAAYGHGWEADALSGGGRLAQEAVQLGRLLVELMPDEPEAMGLLALMLHGQARQAARRDARGAYVPLSEQDCARWSQPMIGEAERWLDRASRAGRLGTFQLEAAIQSVHARRLRDGRTDWASIALLYEGLVRIAPSAGARVGHAAAIARLHGAAAGWDYLQPLAALGEAGYQPYWALAAELLAELRRGDEAAEAYARAIALSDDPAVREFLRARAARGGVALS